MNTTPEVQRLLNALTAISTRASCAPNDDPEVAGQELTHIMQLAREARLRYERDTAPPVQLRFTLTGLGWLVATEEATP